MLRWNVLAAICAATVAACSSSSDSSTSADAGATSDTGGTTADAAGSAQTPPQGVAALDAWLATGAYKSWHCESAVHAQRAPSPHGFVRICSNDAIASNSTGTSPWPVGAAAVKELYNAQTDTTPMGYSVYVKTQSDSASGANWYWYEKVPASASMPPHDANGVVVDGLGSTSGPKMMCVSCHANAGSDATHTPSPGSRDEVYSPVH